MSLNAYRNEENFCLPWEYDKENLTIWQKDTSDDGNQENAEIANNVDPDFGQFIVKACNAHDELVLAAKDACILLADLGKAIGANYAAGPTFKRLMKALAKAGVES